MAGKLNMISAFLFHDGGHDDPKRLAANGWKELRQEVASS